MKYRDQLLRLVSGCLFLAVLPGCATVKEVGKGFIGVSTQVLEEGRKDALKKSFTLDYNLCYAKVQEVLGPKEQLDQKDKESYIYAQDAQKRWIAIYFSSTDTTPIGIFFTQESPTSTLIEISSPSTYAKEEIAKRIFSGIDELINPKPKEKEANVKEKSGN